MSYMKKLLMLGSILFVPFFIVPGHCASTASSIDKLVIEVSSQTITAIHKSPGASKIFFVDFTDMEGQIVFFGRYLVRKLEAEVGKANGITVLERAGIARILEEQKLSLTGIISPEQAQQIGKLYGAKYIVTGILTDLGSELDVTLRIVSVETGEIIGAPNSKIKMTPELSKLVSTIIYNEKTKEMELKAKQRELEAEIDLKAKQMAMEIEIKKKAMIAALENEQAEKEAGLLKVDQELREKSDVLRKYKEEEGRLISLNSQVDEFKARREQLSRKAKDSVACGMPQKRVLEILGKPDFTDKSIIYPEYVAWVYGETWVFFMNKLLVGVGLSKSPTGGHQIYDKKFCP